MEWNIIKTSILIANISRTDLLQYKNKPKNSKYVKTIFFKFPFDNKLINFTSIFYTAINSISQKNYLIDFKFKI
jgi:hypothetical protein